MKTLSYSLLSAAIVLLLGFSSAHALSTFQVFQGGTGSTTLTGLLKGNGTGAIQTAIPGTDYSNFAYPFPSNATSTALTFNAAFSVLNPSTTQGAGTYLGTDSTHGIKVGYYNANNYALWAGGVTPGATNYGFLLSNNGTSAQFNSTDNIEFNISDATKLAINNTGGVTLSSLGNGLVKSASGLLSNASNGTDYTLITANTCGAGNHVSAITAAGVISCTADTGSGGSGLATTSPVSSSNVLVYSASGAGSAYGVATTSATLGLGLSGALTTINNTAQSLSIATSSLYTGTVGQNAYFNGTNSIIGTSTIFESTASKVGIGTTTPNAELTVNANIPGFEDLFRLYNQQSTSGGLWDFQIGAGTIFANGYFNICQGPCTGANYELQFQGFGVAQARGAFSAPAFDSSITGRGSSPILAWTNAGGNFNGTLDVGEQYVSGNISLNNWIGGTGSWNIKRSDGTALALATLLNSNNNLGIGTSTPGTFISAGSSTNAINLDVYATSTLTHGLNITTGCFSVAGVCITGGGTSYTATYPVTLTGSAFGLAFGTTTSNTWAGTQTFTNPIVNGTLSGLISGNAGQTYATATSTASCTGASGITCTSFPIAGPGGTTLALSGIPNSSLANSTISGVALGGTLSALTATNSTLTFSGSYTGTAAQTVGLNLGNANTWSALQQFGNASSSQLSVLNTLSFGQYATSTTDVNGSLALAGVLTVSTTTATSTFAGGFQAVTAKFTGLVEFVGNVIAQAGSVLDFSNATVKEHVYPAFSYATSTAWTGTTTIPLGPAYTLETWKGVKCFTDTGTVNVSFNDGTNRMNMFNASTTIGAITLSTNNALSAGTKRYVDIGTPASTPTRISCTIDKVVNQ